MTNTPVPENQKTDADREAERIIAEKKANAEKQQMKEDAKAGIDRATPGLTKDPEPLASEDEGM